MTFDGGLAERLRHRFASVDEVSERKMFGGLAFLVAGNMCVGIMGSELIARIGVNEMEAALARHGVRPLEGSGRPMRGWVTVGAEAIAGDDDLEVWVERSLRFVRGLPPR